MNTFKKIAVFVSIMAIGTAAVGCGNKNDDNTPHTTYSVNDIENMSDEELEKALQNAADEIEMSEKTTNEAPAEEEGIDIWKDVKVTFDGAEGLMTAKAEYIGNNQIIKDNVRLIPNSFSDEECNDVITGSIYVNGYDKFFVSAWYDEEALKEQGIVLKKRKYEEPEHSEYPTANNVPDFCFFTISGLGHELELSDDTDTSVFADAVDSITNVVKEKSVDESTFLWAKDIEIYPTEFYLVKNTGEGYISYADKDGNFLAWVQLPKMNYLQADGEWCKDIWMMKYSDYNWWSFNYSELGLYEEALLKVNIN